MYSFLHYRAEMEDLEDYKKKVEKLKNEKGDPREIARYEQYIKNIEQRWHIQ